MKDETDAKTWLSLGAGEPPLLWALKYWPPVAGETKFLTSQQYWHVAGQLEEMARETDPCACPTVDVSPFNDMWELKDKGGCLGKINLRVYFDLDSDETRKAIIVMGVHKKEDEGQLRQSVVVRINRRRRLYLESIARNRR